jgi:hypothetical protein
MINRKQLPLILAVFSLFILEVWPLTSQKAIAQSCVADTSCPPQPIQFIPGETVRVEVINRTPSLIAIEQIRGTDAFTLDPSKTVSFLRGNSLTPNFSVVIWEVQGLSLRFKLSQPQKNVLRVEVHFGDGYDYNDSSIYLRNDGRLDVF